MSTAISPQDWQRLSEYLDGQLEQSDRHEVEKMLAESIEWKDASQDLKQVRFALHHAPKRRAPHNFTISAAQAAAIRKPRKSIWLFRVSSAFSTALALLFLVLGFSLKALPQAVPLAAAPAALSPAMDKAAVNDATTPIPVIIWGSPDTNNYLYSSGNTSAAGMGRGGGYGGGGGGAADAGSAEMSSAEAKAVPPAASAPMTSAEQPDSTRSFQPEATAAPEAQTLSAQVLQPVTGTGPILGIQSTGPAAEVQPTAAPAPTQTPEPAAGKSWVWWIAAALLGTAALVTAFLGWKPTDKS
jgi:hypothetical protein